MKKTVLLVALNSKFIHSNLAVHSIATAYDNYRNKYKVDLPKVFVNEFSINDTEDSIISEIFSKIPDVVAFSVYIWNCDFVHKLCKKIKLIAPETKIILGGPQVSFGPNSTKLEDCDYDYIVKGEGERAFFCLVNEIFERDFVALPEWNFSFDGKTASCKNAENLDEYSFVYNDYNIMCFDNRIIYYESSRGCPFRCAYCLSSVCGKVRGLDIERVKSDLKFFLTHNVRQVKFVDRTFNYDKKRAVEIWKYLIENADDNYTNFHFEIGADILDKNSLDVLSKAPKGLIKIEAGIQSFNEKTLQEINRSCDLETLSENLKKVLSFENINIHSDLIIGLPYEDIDSFKNSFIKAYSIKSHQLQLGFLKLLPGAPLNDMIEKHGYIFSPNPPYEIVSNKYLTSFEILFLKKFEDVFEKLFNSGRFVLSLNFLEKYFKNPYEMFEKITKFFEEKNLIFSSVSSKTLYCFLHKFFVEFCQENSKEFDELLLLDYYCSERSEQIPIDLKYLTSHQKELKEELSKTVSDKNKNSVRLIGDKAYIFNYESKDPVNERYSFSQI